MTSVTLRADRPYADRSLADRFSLTSPSLTARLQAAPLLLFPMPGAPSSRSLSLRAHVLLIGVVAIWGSTFVVVKDALAGVSPLLFNLIRMTLAFLCLASSTAAISGA